jgi:hypothetical protein
VESFQKGSEWHFERCYHTHYIPTIQGGEEFTRAERVDWLEETWANTLMQVANETVPNKFVEEGKKRKRQQHSSTASSNQSGGMTRYETPRKSCNISGENCGVSLRWRTRTPRQ